MLLQELHHARLVTTLTSCRIKAGRSLLAGRDTGQGKINPQASMGQGSKKRKSGVALSSSTHPPPSPFDHDSPTTTIVGKPKRQKQRGKQQQQQRKGPSKDAIYGKPHLHDVLLGRGAPYNDHNNKTKWKQWVEERKVHYHLTTPKRAKRLMAQALCLQVWNLNPPGRFLQFDVDENCWYEVEDKVAIDKTMQRMRFDNSGRAKRVLEVVQGQTRENIVTAATAIAPADSTTTTTVTTAAAKATTTATRNKNTSDNQSENSQAELTSHDENTMEEMEKDIRTTEAQQFLTEYLPTFHHGQEASQIQLLLRLSEAHHNHGAYTFQQHDLLYPPHLRNHHSATVAATTAAPGISDTTMMNDCATVGGDLTTNTNSNSIAAGPRPDPVLVSPLSEDGDYNDDGNDDHNDMPVIPQPATTRETISLGEDDPPMKTATIHQQHPNPELGAAHNQDHEDNEMTVMPGGLESTKTIVASEKGGMHPSNDPIVVGTFSHLGNADDSSTTHHTAAIGTHGDGDVVATKTGTATDVDRFNKNINHDSDDDDDENGDNHNCHNDDHDHVEETPLSRFDSDFSFIGEVIDGDTTMHGAPTCTVTAATHGHAMIDGRQDSIKPSHDNDDSNNTNQDSNNNYGGNDDDDILFMIKTSFERLKKEHKQVMMQNKAMHQTLMTMQHQLGTMHQVNVDFQLSLEILKAEKDRLFERLEQYENNSSMNGVGV